MPALLTRMSMPPLRARTSAMAASTECWSVTSVAMKNALSPRRAAVSAPVASSRSAMITCAPSRTKASAMAAPIPRPAPVTTAIFPPSRIDLPIHDCPVWHDGVLRMHHFLHKGMLGALGLVNHNPQTRRLRHLPEAVDAADRSLHHVEIPGHRADHLLLNDMVRCGHSK